MAQRFLGEQFDIHTGGIDHVPIHHTNEIAQSECASGKSPFANFWMHGEFLVVDQAPKMSKSLGNVLTVDTLEKNGVAPLAYRFLCLQSHYRKQLKFTDENMTAAARAYERLTEQCQQFRGQQGKASPATAPYIEALLEAMGNDLNAPQAVANLYKFLDDDKLSLADKAALVARHEEFLGLGLLEQRKAESIPEHLQQMLAQRNAARAAKQWTESDRLRDAILAAGYEILDGEGGSQLKKKI
jgi:cysteinyl-tRNA synthetase